jgi:hypothetical protein
MVYESVHKSFTLDDIAHWARKTTSTG